MRGHAPHVRRTAPLARAVAQLAAQGRMFGLVFVCFFTCGPCTDDDYPTVRVPVQSGEYRLARITGPTLDGGVAVTLPALSLKVDRAGASATITAAAGSTSGHLTALQEDLWPLGCPDPSRASGMPSTLRQLEALRVGARLDLAGVSLARPLLVAGCPGARVVLTEYRLEALRRAFDPLLTWSSGVTLWGDAGPGLWLCQLTPCLVFEAVTAGDAAP